MARGKKVWFYNVFADSSSPSGQLVASPFRTRSLADDAAKRAFRFWGIRRSLVLLVTFK